MLVEGIDPDGRPTAGASWSRPSLVNHIAPLIRFRSDDIVRLIDRHRARAGAPTCGCGRSAARATRSSSTACRCCRSTCGARSSRVDACAMGLFQVDPHRARGRPPAAAGRLRAGVGDAARRGARRRAGRGARGDRHRARRRARARTTRCCGSGRRTRSRGWRSRDRDELQTSPLWAVGTLRRRPGRPVAVGDLARRDRPRHRRRRRRAHRARRRRASGVLWCSMLSRGRPVLAVRVRHGAGRAPALVRRRDLRRGDARRRCSCGSWTTTRCSA